MKHVLNFGFAVAICSFLFITGCADEAITPELPDLIEINYAKVGLEGDQDWWSLTWQGHDVSFSVHYAKGRSEHERSFDLSGESLCEISGGEVGYLLHNWATVGDTIVAHAWNGALQYEVLERRVDRSGN